MMRPALVGRRKLLEEHTDMLCFSSCTDFSIGFVTFKSVASAELALSASEQELCLDARCDISQGRS